jgi:hypothetical protein
MGENQLLDVSIGSGCSDDGGRHVEASFYSCGSFWYGVVGDEEVCVRRELGEAFALSVCVSAEDDSLAADLDSPGQGGNLTVNDGDCIDGHVGVVEDENGR